MPEAGNAIHDEYHWVSRNVPLVLFPDNTRGHDTDEAVAKYLIMLKDDVTVVCIHQRPRLPATDMLDLRVWMALQNLFEKVRFRK